jgi:hypothetical protein
MLSVVAPQEGALKGSPRLLSYSQTLDLDKMLKTDK